MRKRTDESGNVFITESGIEFGPFEPGALFDIEESKIYKSISSHGVKVVEFLWLKKSRNPHFPHFFMVEAKTTPKEPSKNNKKISVLIKTELEKNHESTDNQFFIEFLNTVLDQINHDDYFDDLRKKFNDTLALLAAIYSNRHKNDTNLPELFKEFNFSNINFSLILVIKNDQEEWMKREREWKKSLQEKLRKELNAIVKLWNLSPNSIAVLNENDAREKGLIVNNL